MKKRLIRRGALLLLGLLLLSLLGCSQTSPVGSWSAVIRYADLAGALQPAGLPEMDLTGLTLQLNLNLYPDGSFELYTDQTALDRLLADLRPRVEEAARREMCRTYEITEAQVEERLEELGLTMDQLLDQFFEELEPATLPARLSGSYLQQREVLYFSRENGAESGYTVQQEESTLTLLAPEAEDGMGFGPLLPLEFQRKP